MIANLEQQLTELGAAVAYPATPNFAARLHDLPAQRRRPWPRWRAPLIAAAAALAVILGVPPVRTAVAHWLGIQGVVINPVPSLRPVPTTRAGQTPSDLGTRSTLDGAQRVTGFAPLVPTELGAPDAVYTRNDVGPVLSLAYRPRAGIPASHEPGIGLLITEFRGATNNELTQKFVDPATTVTPVTVAGQSGYWLDGAPHQLAYELPDGSLAPDSLRLAGPTLVFQRGDLTIRIEAAVSEQQALAIAASLH